MKRTGQKGELNSRGAARDKSELEVRRVYVRDWWRKDKCATSYCDTPAATPRHLLKVFLVSDMSRGGGVQRRVGYACLWLANIPLSVDGSVPRVQLEPFSPLLLKHTSPPPSLQTLCFHLTL